MRVPDFDFGGNSVTNHLPFMIMMRYFAIGLFLFVFLPFIGLPALWQFMALLKVLIHGS